MYESEQTAFFSGLRLRVAPETKRLVRTTGGQLRYRHGSLFLALALSTAVPTFADKVLVDFSDGDRGSVYTQALTNGKGLQGASVYRNSSLSTLEEEEFRSESNPVVLVGDFSNDSKISDLDTLLNSSLDSSGHQVSLFDLRFNLDQYWERDGGKGWDDHNRWKRIGNDGPPPVVVTPEPGSLTLLLFGLAGLAMIAYRCNSLKNAI
jgi:hypothetical protein